MVDSFASGPSDPDRAIQLQINEDLRNAQQLKADFEKQFPRDPKAKASSLVERYRNLPKNEALYPKLTAVKGQEQWIMPLLRRFNWNAARGDSSGEWTGILVEMIQFTLRQVRGVSEQQFLALAETGEALIARGCNLYLRLMAAFAYRLEKAGPLSPAAVNAIRQLLEICDAHGASDEREQLFRIFFRSDGAVDATSPSWSARVRRDIAVMPPKLTSDWLRAFDTEAKARQASVKKLGNQQLEVALRRWIGMLHHPEPTLSANDAIVLRHMITLCEQLNGPACDELLYDIARVRWTEEPEHRWMYQFLQVLRSRPQNRAFACLEALMMNPVCITPDVKRQYEGLLAVFGSEPTTESPLGVDGFPLDSDPALGAQQRRIDQFLRMAATAAAAGRYVDPAIAARVAEIRSMNKEKLPPAQQQAIKIWEEQMTRELPWFPVAPEVREARTAMQTALLQEFGSDPASLNRAVTARAEWIRSHKDEYSKDTLQLWNEWLHGLGCSDGLVGRSLSKVDDLDLKSLLRAIRAGGNSSKVFELCQKYVAKHGWHIDLVEPFRQFIPRLGVPSNQTENARAEWFLWFEDVAPIDVNACWSYRMKKDIRDMPPEQAQAWRALLDNPTFVITGSPSAKWMKAAESLFPKVGAPGFRRHFLKWFEPFAKAEPQRITITGRNLLRVLIWYALVAKDDAVDQALLGFANAHWKTKQFATRVAQAEMAFSYVIAQREPKAALPILEALVKSGQAFEGSTTHRVYEDLCARHKRTPVKAMPKKSKPVKKPAPNPLLDTITVGDLDNITRRR